VLAELTRSDLKAARTHAHSGSDCTGREFRSAGSHPVHLMAQRAGSTVAEVKGSHAIYVSKPEAVAALIEKAAKGVKLAVS